MTTLYDPKGIVSPSELRELEEKLRVAQMILSLPPKIGGCPFVYMFCASKTHILSAETVCELYTDDQGNKTTIGTAATDGKVYYWHPDKLRRLTAMAIAIVQMHEAFHVVFQHCDRSRMTGKNKKIWNIAVDYVVNATIEHDFRASGFISDYRSAGEGQEHPLWKAPLHKPLYLKDLIASIKKECEDLKKGKLKKAKKEKFVFREEDLRGYIDYGQYSRSAEDIYEEIMKAADELTSEMLGQLLGKMGVAGEDEHMPVDVSRQELLTEILKGLQYAKSMGTEPGSLEEQLSKLVEPKMSWQDLCRAHFNKFRKDKGEINDWTRFNRRLVSHKYYRPKKKEVYINWLAFLDTSGSMSDEDMCWGVSQLKALEGRSQGIVVPNDAEPHWKSKQSIYSMKDLPKVKATGRGGTCFKQIFEEYPKQVGSNFDVIIIMTDGYIFDLQELKKPPMTTEVVWVLTSHNPEFEKNVPFGRCAPFRHF